MSVVYSLRGFDGSIPSSVTLHWINTRVSHLSCNIHTRVSHLCDLSDQYCIYMLRCNIQTRFSHLCDLSDQYCITC